MADIYAFGPDWAIPPTLRARLETLIGETVDTTGVQWMKFPPGNKPEVDAMITPEKSGIYPVGKNNRATLGIPAGDASGWLTTVYISTTAVGQRFTSLSGEELQRYYGGPGTGWNEWSAVNTGTSTDPTTSWYKLKPPTTSAEVDAMVTPDKVGLCPVSKANRVTLGIPAGAASGWLTTVYVTSTAVGQRFTSLTGEELQRFYGGPNTGWNAWSAVAGGGGSGSGAVAPTGMEVTGEWTTPVQMKAYVAELSKHLEVTTVTIGQTVKGVDIPALIIGDKTKPAFLAVGGQHANELGNTHGLMMWARQLLSGRDQILMDMCVLIVPMLNIDSWMGPRGNANGVDLNRDWVDYTQPETQAVRDWITGFNVIGAVDGHSFGYPREVSMRIPTAGTPAVKAKAQKLYDAIAVAVREDGQFVRNYDVANHPGMMPEGMAALGIPATFTEIPSGYGSLYGDTPKPSPNWQQRMAALTMDAAAHEVWKWTPTYPADLSQKNTPATDSGWRDITTVISPAPTAGRVLIRRSNKNVDLTLDGVTWANDTGTITRTNLIPAGFQPDAPVTHGATSPHPGSARAFTLTSAGAGTFHSLTGGDVLNTTTRFTTTQQWPSTLPGAAA